MSLINDLKQVRWLRVFLFYGLLLLATYTSRQLPNILQIGLKYITDLNYYWNYNHGIAILTISILFYKFSPSKRTFSFLGSNKLKSLAFPCIFLIAYSTYGIENNAGVNKHLWAIIFCSFTLIYDIMEEYVWRGYFIESLGKVHLIIKSTLSGIFWAIWHTLIFKDFEQYGGFGFFLIFCIILSFILTFSVTKTKAILVPATMHALMIRTNIITLLCLIIYMIILFTWDHKKKLI